MARENLNDLMAFVVVAREQSFTRAAAKLGVSQSALSHTIKLLEERLGVRLLTRTTRSVSPTEAGAQLYQSLGSHFDEIEADVASLMELRDKPAGTIRISAADYTINAILWPAVDRLVAKYPDIKVEMIIDYGLTDIVVERFDAGVRLGEQVAKDMISVRIGPDVSFAVVASPGYFETNSYPRVPQDLIDHNCINLRLPTYGSYYAWEFEKGSKELRVRVEGQLAFNSAMNIKDAALAGHGLAYLPQDLVREYLEDGRLVRVLKDWTPLWDGYHIYYPSRRQASPAFRLLLDELRYRTPT